jgi:hypothetical protein
MHKEKSVQGYVFFKWEDFVFQEKRVSIGIVRRVSHHHNSFLKQGGNLSEVSLGSTAKDVSRYLYQYLNDQSKNDHS